MRETKVTKIGDIEVREQTDLEGQEFLDEVVLQRDGVFFHLEQMSEHGWWLSIKTPQGEVHVDLVLERTRSKTAEVKGYWRDETVK